MNFSKRFPIARFSDNPWAIVHEFDELFKDLNSSPLEKGLAFNAKAEIKENDAGYLISFDVPGMKESDIKIEFADSVLKVSGERKTDFKENSSDYFRTEKSYGKFERFFRLPESVEDGKIEAHYKDGVLDVFVPKSLAKQQKTIEVKKDSDSSLLEKWLNKKVDSH